VGRQRKIYDAIESGKCRITDATSSFSRFRTQLSDMSAVAATSSVDHDSTQLSASINQLLCSALLCFIASITQQRGFCPDRLAHDAQSPTA